MSSELDSAPLALDMLGRFVSVGACSVNDGAALTRASLPSTRATRHVHSHVVGEHGDSEVPTWSIATVGGIALGEVAERHGVPFDEAARASIDAAVRGAAYAVISGKGATYYGVGSALARIVEAVLRDQRSVLTACSPEAEVAGVRDVTLSLPHLVGGAGVIETLPLARPQEEQDALARSAAAVRAAIDGCDST